MTWADVPEGAELLHTRSYDVRAYREAADRLRLRGRVRDEKPPGVTIADDPDPLTIHDMVVDLIVAFPSLEIVDVAVAMNTHPHHECPGVVAHYRNLIGLSIARGFTHRVRELFGGPRGCTHTTALLQAMAPIAIQSMWSMFSEDARSAPMTVAERRERMRFNLNTCHVWAEDGRCSACSTRARSRRRRCGRRSGWCRWAGIPPPGATSRSDRRPSSADGAPYHRGV
jgi:hypothetical protein